MRLIREFILKEIILFFIALLIIEIIIIYILSKRAVIIYDATYKETMDKIVNKALEVNQKFEEYSKNYISKYFSDLKLIAMHSILFNINGTKDATFDNEYEIYNATLEGLKQNFRKFNMTEDNPYVNNYEKEFENIFDRNYILNTLYNKSKHPELNTIGYYNPYYSELSEEEQKSIKNMITIFKSLFIKRYLIKRDNCDYLRFFIFNKEKIFIYPPVPFNLTPAYFFDNIYLKDSKECEINKFPFCYYNYLINTYILPVYNATNIDLNHINYLIVYREKMNLQKNYHSICIRMKYLKG